MPSLKYRDPADGQWKTLFNGISTFSTDTGWIDLPLQNGWTNYGGQWETAQYRRVNGIVYLKGLIKPGTTTTQTVIATLPAGFRPKDDSHIDMANSADTMGRINIWSSTGEIRVNGYTAATWWSLANIQFPTPETIPPSLLIAPQPSDLTPLPSIEIGAPGSSNLYSRGDHQHSINPPRAYIQYPAVSHASGWTLMTTGTMIYQKGGMTGTSGSRLNIPIDGLYHVDAQVYFQAGAAGGNGSRRGIMVTRNAGGGTGNPITQLLFGTRADVAIQAGAQCSFEYELAAGDYIECVGYHDAAAAITNLAATGSFMNARWVAPI